MKKKLDDFELLEAVPFDLEELENLEHAQRNIVWVTKYAAKKAVSDLIKKKYDIKYSDVTILELGADLIRRLCYKKEA